MADFIVANGNKERSINDSSYSNIKGFGAIFPINIQAKDIGVSVASKDIKNSENGRRQILQNISLQVPAGKLMAIMGGSGSGKTTLLNTLAGRTVGSATGQILFNGENPKKFHNSGMVAYVQQQDNLLPFITVRETLRYAARLRLPRSMHLTEKYDLVEDVILELGLKECANTLVGDDWRKGISGGEKRRVSVGVQLLMNPSLIFLDEPTTGLDAFSARSLIETLVHLAHKSNRTIILSVHQPRSDIFASFDQIALLTRGGRLAYCGSPSGSVAFLESVGYPLVGEMNGADFIIDTVAIDDRSEEAEIESKQKVDRIVGAWKAVLSESGLERSVSVNSVKKSGILTNESITFSRKIQGAGFFEQVSVLTGRMLVNTWEDRLTLWGSVLEMILMGLVIGAIFWRPDQSPTGMYNRKSALYTVCAMQNYLELMFMIYKLAQEMKVFDRERSDKMYSVSAYMISWISVNFTIYGVLTVIFSLLVYFMVDLRTDNLAYHFGIFVLDSIMQQWITMALAFLCISFSRDFASAALIANSVFTFLSLSSGFFIPETSIPVYIRWIQYISYVTYGNRLFISNEFENHIFACPGLPAGYPACDGNSVITATGFTAGASVPIAGLFGLLILKLLVPLFVLTFFPAQIFRQGGAVKDKKEKKKIPPESIIQVDIQSKPPKIVVELKDLALQFQVKKGFRTGSTAMQSKQILKPVNAEFPPGQLTAILGASGAGKSTLLHLLHARSVDLPSNITSVKTGTILHNGAEFDKEKINACTASVRQDDSHLLPALTARETLRYAAMLRLPNTWPKERKIRRAEEVLLELGLKDCANTIVGGEGVKGLSGGEKRRLSVGLAMLMDPAILLLDEPTSGLDASSARNMMMTLQKIAADGRTVICTVHQPRSDIFPLFDRILLLARGGRVVFQGPGSALVPHFASLNHHLPFLTNPADFALDLSSVDLRSEIAETQTRARVDALVAYWNSRSDGVGESSSSTLELLSGEETGAKVLALSSSKRLSVFGALPLMISRSWLNLRRQPNLMAARIMNQIALGVIFGLYFTKLGNDQAGVTSRIGLLQQCGAIQFIGMLNCMSVFPQELLLFRFEHQDGTTAVESFFMTYTINELPFEFVGAVVYAILNTYVMGLQMNPGWMVLVSWSYVFVGESIGMAFCTIFSKPGFTVQLMSALISVFNQCQGFLSVNLISFLNVFNYISVLRYGARLLGINEFDSSRVYTCSVGAVCQFQNGTQVTTFLGFATSDRDQMLNIIGLLLAMFLYRVIAYGVMKRALP